MTFWPVQTAKSTEESVEWSWTEVRVIMVNPHFWPRKMIGSFFSKRPLFTHPTMFNISKDYKARLMRHLHYTADKYCLPVDLSQSSVPITGYLVNDILSQDTNSDEEAAYVFAFLVRNVYSLGPRIAHEYLLDTCGGDPMTREASYRKRCLLVQRARKLVATGNADVHDVVSRATIQISPGSFEKNLGRIVQYPRKQASK